MKRGMVAAALCALAVSAVPLAARPSEPGRGAETTIGTTTSDASSRIVIGLVTAYKPGKWLVVRTEQNGNEMFKLDDGDVRADIDARVAVGSRVTVAERVAGGARTLTVLPT